MVCTSLGSLLHSSPSILFPVFNPPSPQGRLKRLCQKVAVRDEYYFLKTTFLSSVRGSRANFSMGGSSDSGVHDLPGGHVSRGSIAGDSISIIFDLAVPDAAPAVIANQHQLVRVQPQADIPPDSGRRGAAPPDERAPVYQISGARYDNQCHWLFTFTICL